MIVLALVVALMGQEIPDRDGPAEAARAAELAASDAGGDPATLAASRTGDLAAVCRQVTQAQAHLRDVAEQQGAAKVLVARQISSLPAAAPQRAGLMQAEALLADDDQLSLAYLVLDWSRAQACGG